MRRAMELKRLVKSSWRTIAACCVARGVSVCRETTRAAAASTSTCQPGSMTAALCASTISAGPRMLVPTGSDVRSCTGTSSHAPPNRARRVVGAGATAAGASGSGSWPAGDEATARIDSTSSGRP